MRGVVAAGHPITAQAGADALRAGGNAVDAAVAAVLMSFVTESPLTGPGAGGFMLVHTAAGEDHLLDFFVGAPGQGLSEPDPVALEPIPVEFAPEAIQVFNIGPSSCGVYGTPRGLAQALDRFGTAARADRVPPPARVARDGVELTPIQAYLVKILGPILISRAEGQAIYSPEGRLLEAGERVRMPELAYLLDRLGTEGPGFLYEGDVAAAISDHVLERGGLVTRDDLATYEVVEREPAHAHYRGVDVLTNPPPWGGGAREPAHAPYRGVDVLTNPPPSSGGILISYALNLLERLGRPSDLRALVEGMDRTNRSRSEDFARGLHREVYLESFLAHEELEKHAMDIGSRLGSTTHIAVLDTEGGCATVTCSNGS